MTMTKLRNARGAALIETAITLPILLLVCVSIFEFGRAYQTWEVLTNAAREGARVAIIQGTTDDEVVTQVRNYMSIGQLPNAATAVVTVNRNVALTGSDTASQIQIQYPFRFMVLNPVVHLVVGGSSLGAPVTMTSTSVMRNES